MPISDLWDKVVDHFSTPASLARIEIMTQSASQVEGWFKAEMMLLLKCLREDGILDSWNREVLTGRGREKMDFDVRFGTERAVIEMKAVFCGEQKGTLYRLSSYGTLGGDIHRDVLKISGVRERAFVDLTPGDPADRDALRQETPTPISCCRTAGESLDHPVCIQDIRHQGRSGGRDPSSRAR